MTTNNYSKYLKYKRRYLQSQRGGGLSDDEKAALEDYMYTNIYSLVRNRDAEGKLIPPEDWEYKMKAKEDFTYEDEQKICTWNEYFKSSYESRRFSDINDTKTFFVKKLERICARDDEVLRNSIMKAADMEALLKIVMEPKYLQVRLCIGI